MNKLSFRVVHGLPVLNLEDEIKQSDFAPVQETKNAIDFIMGGGDGWKKVEAKQASSTPAHEELKIRLLDSKKLDQELRDSQIKLVRHQRTILSRIIKVYAVSAFSSEEKDSKRQAVYNLAVEEVSTAIAEFNHVSMVMFSFEEEK